MVVTAVTVAMVAADRSARLFRRQSQKGFTIIELILATGLSLFVAALVTMLFLGSASTQSNASARQGLLVFQMLVDNAFRKEANCTALLINQTININKIREPKLTTGQEGQAITMNLSTEEMGALGLVQEGTTLDSYKFKVEKLRILGAVELPDPTGLATVEKYYSVRLVMKPQLQLPNNANTVTALAPREVTDFIIKTTNSANTTTISSCYKKDFSYRRRCANKGMIYVPRGFSGNPADLNGCVSFSSLK